MARPNILMICDVDGVLVQSFKDTFNDPVLYAKQIKQQPINTGIMDYIRKWYEQTPANITIHIVTKRKASYLQIETEGQLTPICHYYEKIHYYPEHLSNGKPYNMTWKNDKFESIIESRSDWDKVIIVEDDVNQLTSLTFHLKIIEFWLVMYNQFLIKTPYIHKFPIGEIPHASPLSDSEEPLV